MKPTALLTLLACAALASGGILVAASSGAPAGPLATLGDDVRVAPSRAGDVLRYERAWTWDEDDLRQTLVVTAAGPSRAVDRYGVERDTVAFDLTATLDDKPAYATRCHALAGGAQVVRSDVTAGEVLQMGMGNRFGPLGLATLEQSGAAFYAKTSFSDGCAGANPLGGELLRKGMTLPRDVALLGAALEVDVADESLPATADSFEGRSALTFTFPPLRGDGPGVAVTFAHGLPGVARVRAEGVGVACFEWVCAGTEAPVTVALAGYVPAEGDALPAGAGARLPDAHPEGLAQADALRVDDAPFRLAYPYAEAYAALLADPSVCLAAFVRENPDAFLAYALFDAARRDFLMPLAPTDGGWDLLFVTPSGATCEVFSVRLRAPAPGLPGVVRNYPEDPLSEGSIYELPTAAPARLASGALAARLVAGEGQDPAATRYLTYAVTRSDPPRAYLAVSEIPFFGAAEPGSYAGTYASVDLASGGLGVMYAGEGSTTREVTLGRADIGFPEPSPLRAAFAAGPSLGQGLGIGLIAVGLLALLKFGLLPLYTRLVRAALLDNPVRARLYEQVRREPGIHRADLVDYAGVGVGATTRHLDQLVRHGYLVALPTGGFVRYFAAGDLPLDVARREALLQAGSNRRVYDLYAEHPGLTLREAAARLGMSAPSVHRTKKRLEKAGLLPAEPPVRVEA